VAKKKKKPSKKGYGGPYFLAALLCERVVEEKDGTLSIIRIIDKVTFQVPEVPQIPQVPVSSGLMLGGIGFQMWAVIIFKSGSFKGKQTLTIKGVSPDGSKLFDDITVQLVFDGKGESGNYGKIQISLLFRMEGLHWFNLLIDGKPVTRIPFRVILEKVTFGSSQAPAVK
jgi:hypothetical protein